MPMSNAPEHLPEAGAQVQEAGLAGRVIHFCMRNRLVVLLGVVLAVFWGVRVAPFDWDIGWLPRDPVAVDAIPNLGENQQIVFTEWPGRSPQDVEDQITYPLSVSLLGIPGVKSVRSQSMFGFSSIYLIFEEDIEFYWSRSRVLEKLNSLPAGTLPGGVAPALGPDATALGQVFWYTLEGRDSEGKPTGGWDPQELRTIQDWYVRYALLAASGVSEVASIGGFVREYQIDVDPDAMRAHGVTLDEVIAAVRESNTEVGARTIEMNRVEYVVRGVGFLEEVEDIRKTVVVSRDNVPITIDDIAEVGMGPALRRGALDKAGAEAVGGVVVTRYGANPLDVIENVKAKIEELEPGLARKVVIDENQVGRDAVAAYALGHGFESWEGPELNQDAWLGHLQALERAEWPEWATISQVNIVPFYDRTGLIHETLGTLSRAISLEILITVLVVLVMLMHLRSSLLISAMLPLAVLLCFVAMKWFGVTANIVALSGIAIAVGTIVDVGIVLCENILRHLEQGGPGSRFHAVYEAACEVGGAVTTAVATTIVSFLPVFTMTGAEGKMFVPLAYTKTFALIAAVVVALTVIPVMALLLFRRQRRRSAGLLGMGSKLVNAVLAGVVAVFLTSQWMPLGYERGLLVNGLFVGGMLAGLLLPFLGLLRVYPRLLRWCLDHKLLYLTLPVLVVAFGLLSWLGVEKVFGFMPESLRQNRVWRMAYHAFPGLGKEFMPPLDEGSFLYMPTTMPHASIGEALEVLQLQDRAFAAIPEIETVVGKIGRVDSALDPAPISMIETVLNYKPEFISDAEGQPKLFAYDEEAGVFRRTEKGELIPDPAGRPFRQWRPHIQTPDDIWQEIVAAGEVPGTTSAPKLQPIITRLVMLQSGMRAPMGVKVRGPSLEGIEDVSLQIEALLKEVPGVNAPAVYAERIVGKPYLEIRINRDAIARYGLQIADVQAVIEVAIGGRRITSTVEGRERYPVRIRYKRELRDNLEALGRIVVPAEDGAQVPLEQLAEIVYVRGPQVIKSEDTFLTGYVTFDKASGYAEVDVVEACRAYLKSKLDSGELTLPAGVSYRFAGSYEHQVRAQKTLAWVLPVALLIIFVLLYLQFRSVPTTLMVFSGIAVAWGGGFVLLWLYGQPWFLDFSVAGVSMRAVFQVRPVLLSVAVWVGFLALFGIATDDGVVMATYLDQSFRRRPTDTVAGIRDAVVAAGRRRVRPCLMTTATTLLALLPVLTSAGRGSDVMIPMAIPAFGGMLFEVITLFLVPVLYSVYKEMQLRFQPRHPE